MITIAAHPASPRRAGAHKGVTPPPPWSEAELAYLKAERTKIPPTPIPAIAEKLGRKIPATYNRALILGLTVQKHRPYTDADRARLRELAAVYPPMTDGQIAAALGRGVESMRWLMGELGLMPVRAAVHKRHAAERQLVRNAEIEAARLARAASPRLRAPRPDRAPRPVHAPRAARPRPDPSIRSAERQAARQLAVAARALVTAETMAGIETNRALRVLALETLAAIDAENKAADIAQRAEDMRRRQAAALAKRAAAKAEVAARRKAREAARRTREAARQARADAKAAAALAKAVRRAELAAAARAIAERRAKPAPIVVVTVAPAPVAAPAHRPAAPASTYASHGMRKMASRDQSLALSAAAAEAVAAFIAARGVTRPELTPADRLRHLGYEVLAHGKGVILDRKTVLADEVAIAAFLAARETPRAA